MENEIITNELIDNFYSIINDIDDVNKTILLRLYKSINSFLILDKKDEYNGQLYDLLNKYENEAYIVKENSLTDKQIIEYEFSRIMNEYNKQKKEYILDDSNKKKYDDIDLEVYQHLLVLVEYYIQQLKVFENAEYITKSDIDFIKKQLAYIQILLNLKNGFYYENYLLFISELERIENLGNNYKIKKIWSDKI